MSEKRASIDWRVNHKAIICGQQGGEIVSCLRSVVVAMRQREVAAEARAKGPGTVHLSAGDQSQGLDVRPRGEYIAAVTAIVAGAEAE